MLFRAYRPLGNLSHQAVGFFADLQAFDTFHIHAPILNSPSSVHLMLMEKTKDALAEAHTVYKTRNPFSQQAYLAACKFLPGGNTRTVLHALPFPLTFDSGSDCTLTSVDGDRYIDFLGEYTAGIYGHNNPKIRAAINEALDKGWSLGGNNTYEKELARIVCERFRPTMELVRFTNSGTEANMMAVAAALAWTGRKKVLVFDKGYHGATLSFRSTSTAHLGETKKDVNLPHEWVMGTYNDIEKTQEKLSTIPSENLAAILIEPMLGSGGAVAGSLPFLRFLRSYASSHGALLIFDEVMTSRLSYRGLGHKIGIQPDMMTLGKWVGGGMSFGAFGGRRDIMGMFDPRSGSLAHAGTFNNNVMSMAAGCAGCKILDEETTNRLNDLGERMKQLVQDAIDKHLWFESSDVNGTHVNGEGLPTNGHSSKQLSNDKDSATQPRHIDRMPEMWISGIGSILAIHFASSPTQTTLQSLYYHHMLTEGIYLAERGFMALNIELDMEHVQAFVAATGRFIKKYRALIAGAEK